MRVRRRPLLFAGLASLSGCFLTLDESSLHQGAEGGARDGAAIDRPALDAAGLDDLAAADLSDAGTVDATNDLDAARPIDLADAAVAPDLAVPPCTTSLCEDFESPLTTVWASYTSHASVGEDSARAYRGTRSLHFSLDAQPPGSQAIALIGEGQSFSPSPVDFYARAFFYLPSPAPALKFDIMTVFENVSPYDGSNLVVDSGALAIDNQVAGVFHPSTTKLPLDRWTCVEWHVHQASPSGGYDLWLDGQPVASLSITGEATQPAASPLNAFHLEQAIHFSTPALPALELWADSLALDGQRIGCAK